MLYPDKVVSRAFQVERIHNTVLLIRANAVLLLNWKCVGFKQPTDMYNIRARRVGRLTMVVDNNEKKIIPRG